MKKLNWVKTKHVDSSGDDGHFDGATFHHYSLYSPALCARVRELGPAGRPKLREWLSSREILNSFIEADVDALRLVRVTEDHIVVEAINV